MKFKVLLSTSFLALSFNLLAFNVTGDSFKSKFEITSITVGADYSTINATSAAAGQYGKVYLSYTLTSNDTARNQGTFEITFPSLVQTPLSTPAAKSPSGLIPLPCPSKVP